MFTEEIISDLIKSDWYFRIENSNSQEYITVIKGSIEKSLGFYTEEAWKMIIRLNGAVFYPEDDF